MNAQTKPQAAVVANKLVGTLIGEAATLVASGAAKLRQAAQLVAADFAAYSTPLYGQDAVKAAEILYKDRIALLTTNTKADFRTMLLLFCAAPGTTVTVQETVNGEKKPVEIPAAEAATRARNVMHAAARDLREQAGVARAAKTGTGAKAAKAEAAKPVAHKTLLDEVKDGIETVLAALREMKGNPDMLRNAHAALSAFMRAEGYDVIFVGVAEEPEAKPAKKTRAPRTPK